MTRIRAFLQIIFLSLVGSVFLLYSQPVIAKGPDLNIIRDVEIEAMLKNWATPLFKAAGLNPKSVNIILVQSEQINAFVAGGANIFIYTGLLESTNNPGEVIGVMAHEIGHIAGGHLIGNQQAFKRASYESILGTVLGIGAAILTGEGSVAAAVTLGAQSAAAQNYLSHSRINESSADQAALRFMDAAHYDPSGLRSFFETLEDQEFLPVSQQNPYARTHPITRHRIESVEDKTRTSAYNDQGWPAEWVEQHARMKAKLLGFIRPDYVDWAYGGSDHSFAALYARAIAAYRSNKIQNSLDRIDALIEIEPKNPYLYELKGQMLVDYGRVREAVPSLEKMVALRPDSGLFHMALGHALLEVSKQESELKEAISHFEKALIDEPRSAKIYRMLATAEGRLGHAEMADLYLAEEAVLKQRYQDARFLAERVKRQSNVNSVLAIKAQDILDYISIQKSSVR